MTISVRITGLDGIAVELGRLGPDLAQRVILDMSQIAYLSTVAGADRHHKTGALRQSAFNDPITNGRAVGHDLNRAPHALFILFGTKDHRVQPREKKALRWASGGKFFFSKGHMVKGIRADDYMETAAQDAVRAMPGIVDRALKGSA